MAEEWREIKGSSGGFVSSIGRVKNKKGEILVPIDDGQGYLRVSVDGRRDRIHRLVAEAFIPNPMNKEQVNHKNNDKHDNRADNLEWVTNRENSLLAGRDGLIKNGKRRPVRCISVEDESVSYTFKDQQEAARRLNINSKDISKCLTGSRKTSHGFFWEFADEDDLYSKSYRQMHLFEFQMSEVE